MMKPRVYLRPVFRWPLVAAALAMASFMPCMSFAIEVAVSSLTGKPVNGELLLIDEGIVEIESGSEVVTISNPLKVQQTAKEVPADWDRWEIELIDGSRLVADGCILRGERCQLDRMSIDGTQLNLPAKQIRAVWLAGSGPKFANQRVEIAALSQTTDRLVIYRNQRKTIDHLPGVVVGIADHTIAFQYDGDVIDVPLEKVNGLLFFRRPQSATRATPPRVTTIHGDLVMASLRYDESRHAGQTLLRSPLGFLIRSPISAIQSIDFSAGRLLALTELTPARFRHTPAFGFAGEDAAGAPTPTIASNGVLRLLSKSELVYQLPSGYEWLELAGEIDPEMQDQGHVQLSIYLDDRLEGEWQVDGSRPLASQRLPLKGARRLRITVDYGKNLDLGDHLLLRTARLLK